MKLLATALHCTMCVVCGGLFVVVAGWLKLLPVALFAISLFAYIKLFR